MAVTICAGAGHRALMQQAFDELGLPRRRMIGSAPEALAATARALVAIEARVSDKSGNVNGAGEPAGQNGDSVGTRLGRRTFHRVDADRIAAASAGKTLARTLAAWTERTRHGGRAVLRSGCARIPAAASAGSSRWTATTAPKRPSVHGPYRLVPPDWNGLRRPMLTGRDRVVMDEVPE